jgi:hypothetical protein
MSWRWLLACAAVSVALWFAIYLLLCELARAL